MKNKNVAQFVLTEQSEINKNILVTEVSLFDSSGAPVSLGGSSTEFVVVNLEQRVTTPEGWDGTQIEESYNTRDLLVYTTESTVISATGVQREYSIELLDGEPVGPSWSDTGTLKALVIETIDGVTTVKNDQNIYTSNSKTSLEGYGEWYENWAEFRIVLAQ